ncbi:thioredoxin family protein [Chitinophaga nivalis]|uniref:Thioredoxin family protein n=1 Tax=Chitinophaga nivalis TaxID=2991709 RepID=A0ABT3IJQ0_9BACT|nr:thioredoxin family protein [Chitinophaga nivalis]MCW3466141.1 thioredoxin family protein [Chitinophaga nivalis]MCW3484168.1 thioredoxin family protein [Chitinophaga nivalis]
MMKKIFTIVALLIATATYAKKGLQFAHLTWEEALQQAREEKKMIFIDFYTQWCGPCRAMADEVFVTRAVGDFYNTNFINLKIDAESPSGSILARKYGVKVYPTFVYIDPTTTNAVHFSTSRQDEDIFLFTGASALSKDKNSTFLYQQDQQGVTDPAHLYNMAYYLSSIYQREEADKRFNQLIGRKGYDLNNPDIWEYFTRFIKTRQHPLSQDLLRQPERYMQQYGREAVADQVFALYRWERDAQVLQQAPDFDGRKYLISKLQFEEAMKAGNYPQANILADSLFLHAGSRNKELCADLDFVVRVRDEKAAMPAAQLSMLTKLAQYAAYNVPDRDNGIAHFNYARLLEYIIRQQAPQSAPLIAPPAIGAKEYSLRPQGLQTKPVKTKNTK